MRSGLRSNRLVCENAFHRSLRVVEVAADADGMDVLIRRRRHLEALDSRRARRRIEDDDFGAVDARANNAGWRIDYFLVSDRLRESIVETPIYCDIFGSDHCPVGLELSLPTE